MAPPMAKTPTRNQGQGLNQTRKLKNIDPDLIATLPWTMEFMASLAMASTQKKRNAQEFITPLADVQHIKMSTNGFFNYDFLNHL